MVNDCDLGEVAEIFLLASPVAHGRGQAARTAEEAVLMNEAKKSAKLEKFSGALYGGENTDKVVCAIDA